MRPINIEKERRGRVEETFQDWRNIAIALIDLNKGEWKAHVCEIAWLQQPRADEYNSTCDHPAGYRKGSGFGDGAAIGIWVDFCP